MNDHELRHLYERLATRTPADRAGCLTPEQVMRLAAGDAPEAERLDGLEHVATCGLCRTDFDLAAAVVAAGVALERRPRFSPWLALAASVVLLAGGVTLWRAAGRTDDVRRGGNEDRVTLVAPIGTVPAAAAERLVWRAVPGATSFEIEVIDANGSVVFGAGTPDTATTVPAGTLRYGAEYRWRVTAVLTDGSRRQSAAELLVVRRP